MNRKSEVRRSSQTKTFRVFEPEDGPPSVVVDGARIVVDGTVQHEGDLVEPSLHGDAEPAIFDREAAIGFPALVVRVVEVLALGDELPVDKDPDVAEPAELDELFLGSFRGDGGAQPGERGRVTDEFVLAV